MQDTIVATHGQMLAGNRVFSPATLRTQMNNTGAMVQERFLPALEAVAEAAYRDFRILWLPGMQMPNLTEEQAFMNFTRRYSQVMDEYFQAPVEANNAKIFSILDSLPPA